MNKERLLKVIMGPHVSEKSSSGAEGGRQYVFKVATDANKTEICAAIELLLDVKVDSVRVCNMKGKTTRFGRTLGRRNNWKKAYITLAEGSEIEMGEMSA